MVSEVIVYVCVVIQFVSIFTKQCFIITDSTLHLSSLDIYSVFCKYACNAFGRYIISALRPTCIHTCFRL